MNDPLDGLCCVYQPIVETLSGKVSHCEALVRLRSGQHAHVIGELESTGEIHRLDFSVLGVVLSRLHRDKGLRLAVNVSISTIENHGPAYLSILNLNQQIASRLILEITETLPIKNMDAVLRFVKSAGLSRAHIALDDFGAGQFKDEAVELLKPAYIKLSAGIVKRIMDNGRDCNIIPDLKRRISKQGVRIIAEQIDSVEKMNVMKGFNIPLLQGFLFGCPEATPFISGVQLSAHHEAMEKRVG